MRAILILIFSFTLLGNQWNNCLWTLGAYTHLRHQLDLYFEVALFKAKYDLLGPHCIGQNQNFVLTFLGKPKSVTGPILIEGFPYAAARSEKNWRYDIQGDHYLVSFNNGKCVSIEQYGWELDCEWQFQRINHLLLWPVGKSAKDIFQHIGEDNWHNFNISPARLKPEKLNDSLHYNIGYRDGLRMEFVDGICVKTCRTIILH